MDIGHRSFPHQKGFDPPIDYDAPVVIFAFLETFPGEARIEEQDVEDILDRVTRLVRARRSDLVGLARAEGVNPEDAVDALQEGLCALLDLAGRGGVPESEDECSRLLAGMVRNAARNRRRRHYRSKPHDSLDAHPLASQTVPLADALLAMAEQHVRLRECVEELCEIQRAVVTLRMLEEQPGEDVAHALGISAGHVAVLLHRAKLALRACMTRPVQT